MHTSRRYKGMRFSIVYPFPQKLSLTCNKHTLHDVYTHTNTTLSDKGLRNVGVRYSVSFPSEVIADMEYTRYMI